MKPSQRARIRLLKTLEPTTDTDLETRPVAACSNEASEFEGPRVGLFFESTWYRVAGSGNDE
jgi:hypothetical protein